MNKILSIFSSYNLPVDSKAVEKINDLDWKTSDITESGVLFYRFNTSSDEEIENFHKRIKDSTFALCLTNCGKPLKIKNVFELSLENFNNIKEELLDELYPCNFLEKKTTLGVTGTNGKTTTVYLLAQLGMQLEKRVLTVGTLGVLLNNKEVANYSLTTPDYIDLRKELYKHREDFDIFAMELSSHALSQNRLGSIKFNQIGWTNFTQDHLDYHNTMDEYFLAKCKVFEKLKDSNGSVFIPETQEDLIQKLKGRKIRLAEIPKVKKNPFFKMDYNLENLSLAKSLLENEKDFDFESLSPSPGRFNIINYKDSYIIIDYAHTSDALESICHDIKKSFDGYELITIFGCGGDRDRSKRPLMAKAAQKYSNSVIVTSDNPRFEEPEAIIDDVIKGLSEEYHVEVNREDAIKLGIKLINKKAVLLIAGKGHEPYIDIKGVKHPYNDEACVRKILNG